MADYYQTYYYTIPDKSKDVIVKAVFSVDEPFEAAVYDFSNEMQHFTEAPPSEANLKKYKPATATRILAVTNVTTPNGQTLKMTVQVNGNELTPFMEGVADDNGVTFYATIIFS